MGKNCRYIHLTLFDVQGEKRTAVGLVELLGIDETVLLLATLLTHGNDTETLGKLWVVRRIYALMIHLVVEQDEREGRSGRWWLETNWGEKPC